MLEKGVTQLLVRGGHLGQTSCDEVVQGVSVAAGSLLHVHFATANVDEEEFECPFDLDLERHCVTRHLAFSAGPRVSWCQFVTY